jgi:transcriptional regulator with XRE-family HTH domain
MSFRGDRLQGIRKAKGLLRAGLASLTDLDAGGIQHLEEGKTKNPRYDTVEKLAEKLDVTVEYFGGAGPDLPYPQAMVLQALERFKRVEGWKFAPLDHEALARAAEDADAPDTVRGWRAFLSMSKRAWNPTQSAGENDRGRPQKRGQSRLRSNVVSIPGRRGNR